MNDESCVYCTIKIPEFSVIFVREKVDGKWGSHACCTRCWYKKNPDRVPHRVNIKALDESENE